ELFLVGRVVGHRGSWIFQLMSGENAHHALVSSDDAFRDEHSRAGNAGRARRLAAQSTRADLRFGVENLLIIRLASHAVAYFERPQALVEIDRPIDFDGAGDRRGPFVARVELCVVLVDDRAIRLAAVPAQPAPLEQLVERIGAGGIDDRQAWNA